ncbi:MAG: hypothetical protein J0G96_02050 [Flavobacteriia bacterium]|nr:hypothetical protein [Flavobacteriia bacterium]OJX37156.1 MAG: hypothetical protein BGO87_15475 [Flavobacteriia bacterium 40-80]
MKPILFKSRHLVILISVLIIFLFVLFGFKNIISWDTFGQYCYLPSFFIDRDLTVPLSHFDELNNTYQFSSTLYQFNIFNDVAATKYTCGLALLSAPFFIAGHIFALIFNYPPDGYSLPYSIAFGIGCIFYAILGLFYLRKVLLHFFDEKTTMWTIVLLVFGTNFLLNATGGRAFTHTFSFTFLAILIWKTIKFHQFPTIKNGFLLGASLAILGLIRFPDLLFGLIPLFWNVNRLNGFKHKMIFFKNNHLKEIIAVFLGFILFISIQFIFWKITSGKFLIDSYANNPGEGFDWFHPYTYQFLFSFKKGWFIYTPIAILAIIGLVRLPFKKENGLILTITFFIFLYVASCWTTWWYAGSFSSRAMIDSYPVLAIGFGILLSTGKRKLVLIISVPLLLLNIFQFIQYKKGIISMSQMTKEYYFSTFGQLAPATEAQKELLELDYFDYFDRDIDQIKLLPLHTWKAPLKQGVLNEQNWFTENIEIDLSDYYQPQTLYLVTATWTYEKASFKGLEGLVPNMAIMYKNKTYDWRGAEPGNPDLSQNIEENTFTMKYVLLNLRTKKDKLRVQVWRKDPKDIEIKSVEVTLFRILGKKSPEK